METHKHCIAWESEMSGNKKKTGASDGLDYLIDLLPAFPTPLTKISAVLKKKDKEISWQIRRNEKAGPLRRPVSRLESLGKVL